MEVIELIFSGYDLNNRQRARVVVANNAHGKFGAFDKRFDHGFVVDAQSQVDRAAQFIILMDDRHTEGAALGRGLHHAGNANLCGNLFEVFVIELVALANNGGSRQRSNQRRHTTLLPCPYSRPEHLRECPILYKECLPFRGTPESCRLRRLCHAAPKTAMS